MGARLMPYSSRTKRLKYLKAYQNKNRKRLQEDAKKYYIRRSKDGRFIEMKRVLGRAYSERLKLRVINFYCKNKPRCQCKGCPIRHPSLLTVDHKISAGNALARRHQSGGKLYRKLVKRGYPKSFQILCASCNLAKGDKKQCPRYGKAH
jgi:5-methylcytosine-specific restriction endonuclease McrA